MGHFGSRTAHCLHGSSALQFRMLPSNLLSPLPSSDNTGRNKEAGGRGHAGKALLLVCKAKRTTTGYVPLGHTGTPLTKPPKRAGERGISVTRDRDDRRRGVYKLNLLAFVGMIEGRTLPVSFG